MIMLTFLGLKVGFIARDSDIISLLSLEYNVGKDCIRKITANEVSGVISTIHILIDYVNDTRSDRNITLISNNYSSICRDITFLKLSINTGYLGITLEFSKERENLIEESTIYEIDALVDAIRLLADYVNIVNTENGKRIHVSCAIDPEASYTNEK